MHFSTNQRTRFNPHARWLTALALLLLAACATPENPSKTDFGNESTTLAYVHRTQQSFVRIEKIEVGAPVNSHPVAVSAETLRATLGGMRVAGAFSISAMPLFTGDELTDIAAPLAAALAKAGVDQDVTFGVSARRGTFGSFSTPSFTTGRVFVRGSTLNVVFGRIQELYTRDSNIARQDWTPGSRTRQLESGVKISPGTGRLMEKRNDWVAFELATLTSTPAPAKGSDAGDTAVSPAPQSAPAAVPAPAPDTTDASRRAQKMTDRLRILDELKRNGTVTEDEYRERRRAILLEI